MENTLTNTTPADRVSGGEIANRGGYLRMRALIQQESDVHEVLALSWLPQDGRWLYLIKTPFATWPKYVVGYTDTDNESPSILLRCGHEANARACFDEYNMGDHL